MTSRVEELQRMCDHINENGGLDLGEWRTALLVQIAQNLAIIADVMTADRKTEPQTCENRECKNYDTINDHCMFIEQCHYEPKEAPTANPYKIVLEDLKQVPMFTGKYDKKNGNKHFMYGILTVLKYIADKAKDEEYPNMFLENMSGDKAVVKKGD